MPSRNSVLDVVDIDYQFGTPTQCGETSRSGCGPLAAVIRDHRNSPAALRYKRGDHTDALGPQRVVGESGHCPDIPYDNTPRSFGILFSEQAVPKVLCELTDRRIGPGGDRKEMDV